MNVKDSSKIKDLKELREKIKGLEFIKRGDCVGQQQKRNQQQKKQNQFYRKHLVENSL